MEKRELLSGRIQDLSRRAFERGHMTHTGFLSASELSQFYEMFPCDSTTVNGAQSLVFGGHTEADRQLVCFLPSYMDPAQFLKEEMASGGVIRVLHAEPVQAAFADELTHRDYLGALMHLGIAREVIGDILQDTADRAKDAYIYVLAEHAPHLQEELVRVKHTTVRCRILPPSGCHLQPRFEAFSGSVASSRLDAVLSMACKLSRSGAQERIARGDVALNGMEVTDPARQLREGERISIRGFGKFLYDGEEGRSRKGRIFVRLRRFL